MRNRIGIGLSAILVVPVLAAGCAVGQKPGKGQVLHRTESSTRGSYYLYLPEGYDEAVAADKHLPLVMTFHGMKPFDNAGSQIREWQQEADRYGYVVCAPKLLVPDISSPLPLRTVNGALKTDEQRILAIMDEIVRTTNVDPNAVLSTSWSYGGYVAHFMANRHPERFSCIAVKQSNFSEDLLDPQQVPKYRDYKVAVFYTQNDFKICREESKAAAQWYSRHGFDLTFAVFQDLGHERRPGVAAAFFAKTCNATPKSPPTELARMQVLELPASETAVARATTPIPPTPQQSSNRAGRGELVASARRPTQQPKSVAKQRSVPPRPRPIAQQPAVTPRTTSPASTSTPPGRRLAAAPRQAQVPLGLQSKSAARSTSSANNRPSTPVRARPVTPPRQQPSTTSTRTPSVPLDDPANPIRVRLSSTIGISPLLVSYSVAPLPSHIRNGAYYLWTDNGEPISNGVNGQKFLIDPGNHKLEVLVTTSDGREFRASQVVTVLERIKK